MILEISIIKYGFKKLINKKLFFILKISVIYLLYKITCVYILTHVVRNYRK